MEDFYRSMGMEGFQGDFQLTYNDSNSFGNHHYHHQHQLLGQEHEQEHEQQMSRMSDLIKSQIASHPLYPQLLSAYISCQKVGAPPEIATLLEEIQLDNRRISSCTEMGIDPELDEFMESYCEVLHRYKEELSRPLDEAAVFLKNIESQLHSLCRDTTVASTWLGSDEAAMATSEDELSGGEVNPEASELQEAFGSCPPDKEMKEILLRKYSGYLSTLRKDFLKKRKNGKLPKNARTALLEWWTSHCRWPYPTEEEKLKLSEETGLDQKQINNWFINQRKRHWKPSEDMRFALMEGVRGGTDGGSFFDSGGGSQYS